MSLADGQDERRDWSLWMEAAQQGDRAAYQRLLRDIVPYLRRIAARYARTADHQEDIV